MLIKNATKKSIDLHLSTNECEELASILRKHEEESNLAHSFVRDWDVIKLP